jgi:hypothetical protein
MNHPTLLAYLAADHQAELHRSAERHRRVRIARRSRRRPDPTDHTNQTGDTP